MAKSHGRTAYFSIEDSGGSTLRNISGDLTNVDHQEDVDIPDTSALGDSARGYEVVGLIGNSFSISGHVNPAATTGAHTVLSGLVGLAGTVGYEYGPQGNASGATKYSGEARLTSYSLSTPVDGVSTFSASFVVDGAVGKGTF